PRGSQGGGRDPQLLRAAVPRQAGRRSRSVDHRVVRGDQAGQVRLAVRRAVRVRSLRRARLDLRPLGRGLHEVGGREPDGRDGRGSEEMSAHAATAHTAHAHHDTSFVRTYVFSTDHKMIARQFLFMGLFMMIIGGLLALMVRWQLAWPETAVPGLSVILKDTGGILEPSTYNMAFTMHATIMIFFVIMPILAGAFGNFCIPLMIGARDMAFPFLNMLSFWVTGSAGIIMLSGFFVEGGHAAAGWTSYAPLLWQHLFWYFGHPEVYILILPAMGIASEILPVFCRKPIFGYHAMAFSMIGIAFLSWIVYGHHMFVSGMSPALGMAFTVTTMII